MTFTIHRGTKEIGGSCVEICTATTRVVVDAGMPLVDIERAPPSVPALFDAAPLDKPTALLISHAHQDHYGYVPLVQKKIPVYLGEGAHKLIEVSTLFFEKGTHIENPNYFNTEQPFVFGDIEITPYLMDHAAFDAYAFLIKGEGQSLFYTGDFRSHGRKWKWFYRFLRNAPQNVDYLLMEGTCLSRDNLRFFSETHLERDFSQTFRETRGINLIYVSGQNIDRLVTIDRACKQCGKIFVIDLYVASVLQAISTTPFGKHLPSASPGFPEIRVFFPYGLKKRTEQLGHKDLLAKLEPYAITADEIEAQPDRIVMTVRPSMQRDLERMQSLHGTLIYSMWAGYKEDKKTETFLTALLGRGMVIKDIHTSGHADRTALQKIVDAIKPRYLVPIHTFEGAQYQSVFANVSVKMPGDDEIVEIKSIGEAAKSVESALPVPKVTAVTLLDHLGEIGEIHETAKGLPETIFDKVRPHLDYVCEKLQITDLQAILFSDLVALYQGSAISIHDLAEFMGCKSLQIIKFFPEFIELEQKNLVNIVREELYRVSQRTFSFEISVDTFEAIQKGEAPKTVSMKNLSTDEFFAVLYKICEDRVHQRVSYLRSVKIIEALLENNTHISLVKALKVYDLSHDDEFIILRFCHYLIDLDLDEMDLHCLSMLYTNDRLGYDFMSLKRQLKAGNHVLQQKKLIEYATTGIFAEPDNFRLSEKARNELLSEFDDQIRQKTIKGLVAADTIKEKPLFYPPKTTRQIDELTSLLCEDSLGAIQKRLSDTGMRTGFACLFSGGPGTGKTETAHQIARKTGRPIMQVDIAETKSMWFGESEKKIKEVFSKYRNAVKFSAKTPILLFNEADAVIGKRQNLGESRSGAGQTENTIQNIILQEIESLNGILIATTNMTQNMDKAFERRFLYKIEFEKPTLDARRGIWHSLVPDLTGNETHDLASRFDFSGGQIENISRKYTVHTVLHGERPSFETIVQMCDDEKNEEIAAKIGFGA